MVFWLKVFICSSFTRRRLCFSCTYYHPCDYINLILRELKQKILFIILQIWKLFVFLMDKWWGRHKSACGSKLVKFLRCVMSMWPQIIISCISLPKWIITWPRKPVCSEVLACIVYIRYIFLSNLNENPVYTLMWFEQTLRKSVYILKR